jgi:two-component system sensor histidine kinase PilS (NtrC family)
LRSPARDAEVLVSLAALAPGSREGTLVFVEDAAETRQRAQQLKLASLGRLTASIAHEVRNPLGAISHAAQLLSESEATNEEDRRLMRIIQDHSGRVNRIIENVLRIGRRDGTAPEVFAIGPWLTAFVADLIERRQLVSEQVLLGVEPGDIRVVMDPTQLHQVLWNLCENALRYSGGSPLLTLWCARKPIWDRPYLDVIDRGPGIPEDIARHVFEPFVSRESTGTGLGLYIALELCECNQATLNLHANGPEGCTFRIGFAHPGRQQWIA